MRKVKLFVANSLDGYIARADGSMDWLFHDQDYGMSEFYETVDTAIIGRKTYDTMLSFGESSYPGLKNYVITRSRRKSERKDVEFVSTDVAKFVKSLKRAKGKDIWLVGGGELTETFLNEGLVDEFILTVHPVVLGSGIPLFRNRKQLDLKLAGCETYESGIIQVTYGVRKARSRTNNK